MLRKIFVAGRSFADAIGEAMRFVVIAVALVGCTEPAPRVAPAPCPDAAAADGAPKAGAEPPASSVVEALTAAGHACRASDEDEAVTVCRATAPGLVPFVVVSSPPMVLFASYFRPRPGVGCDALAPVLNDLNAKADAIKLVCDGERVSFVTTFVLPERGFTRDEVADQARRFQGLIQLMLREEPLRERLE